MMTDIEKLKEVLNNQEGKGVWTSDWERLSFVEKPGEASENTISLIIENLQVGFSFTLEGQLIGGFNFKQ